MALAPLIGERWTMTYQTTEEIYCGLFTMLDSAKAGTAVNRCFGYVKKATEGCTVAGGLVGVTHDGIIHGKAGTAASPYAANQEVGVMKRGVIQALMEQTTDGEEDSLGRDDLVCVGPNSKAKKWVATDIAAGMTATLSADPTNTEVVAYIAEYMASYTADRERIVGRVVGDPDYSSGKCSVELIGTPSMQEA